MTTTRAWAWGGLTVAAAEAVETCAFWWFYRGVTPGRIFQFIASGLLGPPAFERGAATVWLGVVLHFFIAFVIAAVYLLASRRYSGLVRRPAAWGLAYGAAVHCVMQYVVIPLSAAPAQRWNALVFAHGLISQAVTVGLPSAYFARAARRP